MAFGLQHRNGNYEDRPGRNAPHKHLSQVFNYWFQRYFHLWVNSCKEFRQASANTAVCNRQRAVYSADLWIGALYVWIIQGFGEVKTRLRESRHLKLLAHMILFPDGVDSVGNVEKSGWCDVLRGVAFWNVLMCCIINLFGPSSEALWIKDLWLVWRAETCFSYSFEGNNEKTPSILISWWILRRLRCNEISPLKE